VAAPRQRAWTCRVRPARAGDGRGQGLVEYGIILGLTALFIVILLVLFDDQVATVLGWLSAQLP
jgi:Flp pilus assembly pilin Flp